jgi:hypothetical protein
VIIADASICKELRLLESEFDEKAVVSNIVSEEQTRDLGRPRSREEVMHFLNELGWLFQRKSMPSMHEAPDYSYNRFKFLLIFSVERDYCVLVKTILDMLVERNTCRDELSKEHLEMLYEIQLLNRSVKRRCRKMADLLIHYSIIGGDNSSRTYIFPPNIGGPGGITPLHLAACASGSDDLVDALTNDPHEVMFSFPLFFFTLLPCISMFLYLGFRDLQVLSLICNSLFFPCNNLNWIVCCTYQCYYLQNSNYI